MGKTVLRGCAWLLLSISVVSAKDKPRIVIEVVDTQTSERPVSYTVPGTASQSTTNCNGTATATGLGGGIASANGTSNCTTTTTPGAAPRTVVGSVEQVHVQAIMPNGMHITLWCQRGFRSCSRLAPGRYEAQVDGNSAWIYAHDLDGKERKIKYRPEGNW